ncbi:hypothetical protein GCM10027514_01910 [Azotobacter armeniacus]
MTERGSLMDKLKRMQERNARGKEAEPSAPAAEPVQPSAQVIWLPLWPEGVRGVPNSVLRSALFGAIKRGRRAFLQREQLTAVDGVTVLFTGPRLDQADLDVWEQCLHLARAEGLGSRIQFAAHGFLKGIGRSTGGKDVSWLKGAFARLASSVVEIKDGKRAYFGPMLHGGARNEETGHYVIEMNPQIVALYGCDGWTQVEWEQRRALKGQPLAQWLHSFYSTHAAPFPMKVETIHHLCGSEAGRLAEFRRDLKDALAKVEAVTGWSWEIDRADLVQVDRTPSASQKRHLIRRTQRKPKDTV